MCVALNGFHCSGCTYAWSWDIESDPIPHECYPVLYSSVEGKYVCTVHVEHYKAVQVFDITSRF